MEQYLWYAWMTSSADSRTVCRGPWHRAENWWEAEKNLFSHEEQNMQNVSSCGLSLWRLKQSCCQLTRNHLACHSSNHGKNGKTPWGGWRRPVHHQQYEDGHVWKHGSKKQERKSHWCYSKGLHLRPKDEGLEMFKARSVWSRRGDDWLADVICIDDEDVELEHEVVADARINVDRYLSEHTPSLKEDPLVWWKLRDNSDPTLSILAKKIFMHTCF